MLKLNLGCGHNKVDGFINVDADKDVEPDLILSLGDFNLPFENESVDEIWCSHTLEHIEKSKHDGLLVEINRVCIPGAIVYFSYPEFLACVQNWEDNYKGKREFWEHTIFGRGLTPLDKHVCIMHSNHFKLQLERLGFYITYCGPESEEEPYNTLVKATKLRNIETREMVLEKEIFDAGKSD